MSAKYDPADLNSGVVNVEVKNEAINVVSVGQLGNETLIENRSNQHLVGESVVDGVKVFGEGNEVGEGLRVQMEDLDVEIDLDSGDLDGQMRFLGNDRVDVEPFADLGVNESTGKKFDQFEDLRSVACVENHVCDAQGGFSHLARNRNVVEGSVMQDVLGGKNEFVPDGIVVNSDFKGVDINGNEDGLKEEQLIEAELKNEDGIGVRPDAVVPERRGDEDRMEEEGKFYVSDLVWGKVRSHPWWPGQIFEPSAASDRAMKYFKKDSYLIAYFGDQTFAWNEASRIKPFKMYFSQMEKQSNSERFSHAVDRALDEVSRRIQCGLACPCLQEETWAKMKSQIVMNAGIRAESSMRVGGDYFSDETSFNPAKLVRSLKSAAAAPHSRFHRLSFILAKAQLAAFNRWKGYYELPVIEEYSDLENDNDVEPLHGEKDASDVAGVASEENSDLQGTSSTKRRRHAGVDEHQVGKEKSMSVLVYGSSSGIPNNQKKSRGRAGRERKSMSFEKRSLAFDSLPSDSKAKKRKKAVLQSSGNKMSSPPKSADQILMSTDGSSQRRIGKRSEKSRNVRFGDSVPAPVKPEERLIPKEFPPPTEMLSKLYLAARDPMNGYSILLSLAGLFCDYRNMTSLETTESGDHTNMAEKHIEKKSSNSASPETLLIEGIEDSYWTDRIIQCNPEDQVLFEVQNQEDFPNAKWDTSPGLSPSLNNKQEVGGSVENSERENLSVLVHGNSEYSPTALVLNFSDLESIPPIADLNRIFSQYGPLCESETEVIDKSKRGKVVFKRRADAETAFSTSGKFSIFGPSLISYRLQYSPSPRKASCTSKRKRKYAASLEVNGV
ncbi:PREDICTED: uncharacterized protein LOC109229588 [Nicotiana attenuata]|uniref:PWWP domain-containing protein n=1 Tax=Nicotiana attenuata TaxID=49451 RepID=A0A1J6IUC6_NICAT|nr:PREDICTED: uncharacterized protein LOC109229588 [Nicotiana attenuata]OIT01295.1 hypothetical protein A4A49_33380 [Nicotiana attenuata]